MQDERVQHYHISIQSNTRASPSSLRRDPTVSAKYRKKRELILESIRKDKKSTRLAQERSQFNNTTNDMNLTDADTGSDSHVNDLNPPVADLPNLPFSLDVISRLCLEVYERPSSLATNACDFVRHFVMIFYHIPSVLEVCLTR
jgi:hypothetical protein